MLTTWHSEFLVCQDHNFRLINNKYGIDEAHLPNLQGSISLRKNLLRVWNHFLMGVYDVRNGIVLMLLGRRRAGSVTLAWSSDCSLRNSTIQVLTSAIGPWLWNRHVWS